MGDDGDSDPREGETMPEYISPGQAADLLGVTRDTIRRYVDQGLLTGIKTPGGQRRVERSSIEHVLHPDTPKAPGH